MLTLKDYINLKYTEYDVKALTNLEAKVFGFCIKEKGWFVRNMDLIITENMLLNIEKIVYKLKGKVSKRKSIFKLKDHLQKLRELNYF